MRMRQNKLILASASPRRRELLAQAGYSFQVLTSPIEEPTRCPKDILPEMWPVCLAYAKAQAVQRHYPTQNATIIGADTIVLLDGQILGKPRNRSHAKEMLSSLSGKRHAVITGLALISDQDEKIFKAVSICRMKKLSPQSLNAYLDSGLWKGKAGAYGIQDHDPFVSLISGEWSNVVGLPIALVKRELRSCLKK